MSITLIQKINPNCDAIVTWLSQEFVLDFSPNTLCVTEMVVKCIKGKLEQINIHVPYNIFNLEDRCFSLLDNLNKYIYSEDSYELLEKKDDDEGGILLDYKETNVSKIKLTPMNTAIGINIKINFEKPIVKNERRAIRITYYCEELLLKKPNNDFAIQLKYLDSTDALLLSIDETIGIKKLFLWLIYPANLNKIVKNIPEFWQQRLILEPYYKYRKLKFGKKTKEIWSQLPRTAGMWARGILEPDKELSEEKWPRIYYYCEYNLSESTKRVYARLRNNENLPNGIDITKEQFNEILSNKDSYDLFIDELSEKIYFEDNEVMKRQTKTKRLLSYLLKSCMEVCLLENIEYEVFKTKIKNYDLIKQHKYKIIKAIPKLKEHIIPIEGEGYKFIGDISFCIISSD